MNIRKAYMAAFLFGLASPAHSQFTIVGKIDGIQDNSVVQLVEIYNSSDTAAKGIVRHGELRLSGHINEPSLYELDFNQDQKKVAIFVGNENITVTGNVNDLQNLKIIGSKTNDDFTEFQRQFNSEILRLNTLVQTINGTRNITKDDTLVKEYLSLIGKIQADEDRFIDSRKASFVSGFVVYNFFKLSDDVFMQEKRLNSLTPEVQNGFFGKIVRQQIAVDKVGAIGSEELDFTENDTDGKPVSLSSFKGKYVLVDFWASWCHPCRLESPSVVSAFNKFRNKNFTILSVSLDKSRDPWLQAIKEDNLTWTHVSDLKFWNNDVALKYHIVSIPQNFLIDPKGKIVAKNLRGADLESKLCELLGCN
ncbi:MAG TPA: TlpA disulfide reductase family protein [Puia sp.]|nr:TlpA disulfide reductase family protein [Puia sp.]